MATTPSDSHVFVVLADDDRYYQPTALELMERSITNDPTTAVSFYTYDLRDTPLRVGQGADLHAFDARNVIALGSSSTPQSALGRESSGSMMDFYLIARQLDVRFALHDDLWVSMYLQDARRVPIANVLSGNTCPAVGNVLGPWRDWSTALWNAQFDAQGNQNSSKGLSRVQLTFRLAQLRERLLSAYLAITAASSSNASSHCQLRTKTTSESTNGAAAAEAEMKAMELLQSPAANVLHSFSRTPSIWQALADYNTSIRFEDADQSKWLQDDAVYPASCECDGGVGSSPSCPSRYSSAQDTRANALRYQTRA